MQTVEETHSWYHHTQPAPAPHRTGSTAVEPLLAGPLVPGTCPRGGLLVVVVVVVAAVVPVD